LSKIVALALAFAFCLTPAISRADTVEDVVRAGLDDAGALTTVVRHLTEAIGPRLTGSPALLQAHRFAAERFRSAGLEVALEPFSVAHSWERGPAVGELLAPYRHVLQLAQVGWTPATEAPVTGPLRIFAPKSKAEMAPFRGRLKDAIVLLGEPATELEPLMMVRPLRIDPKGAQPPPKETGPSLVERIQFLRAEGARAFLWDSGKPEGLLDMGDYDLAVAGKEGLPGAFVIHEQYLLLRHLAAAESGATVRLSLEGHTGPAVECLNTVATIRGTVAPDEFVLLGAHLDSWDLGTGAVDNAAGAAAVIEAGRLLAAAGAHPRRSIRFVLFSGEEQGLFGSVAYVAKHKAELPRHSAVFVIDTGTGRIDGLALQGRAEVEPVMRQVFEPLVSLGVVDTDLRLEWGSDHLPFDGAGVPAFCFEQVQHDYSRNHHSEADTFDKVKPAELQQVAVVAALAAYRTAQLPDLLPRRPKP
jgi:carboxypeptidase Q